MSDWRFTAYDLRSGVKLTDLNVQSWESLDELRGDGSFSAVIELDGATASTFEATAALPITADGEVVTSDGHVVVAPAGVSSFPTARRNVVMDSTRTGRSLIVAERDGVPLFSGIVWRRRYDARSRLLSVAGAGMRSYWRHWVPGVRLVYADQDQFAIVRALVTKVQSAEGPDIGVQVTAEDSGVVRTRVYEQYEGPTYGELIENLSNVIDGFDWACRVEYSAGTVERWLRLWYPRRGRPFSETNLRFRGPGNAVLFDFEEDATDMAVRVIGLGAGEGFDMLVQVGAVTELQDQGWPGYTTQRAYKDVKDADTLASHALADAERLSGVDREVYQVQVDPGFEGQPWGSWDLGDDCVLILDDDPAFPAQDDGTPGLVKNRRVVSHSWMYSTGGEELVVGLGRKVVP